MNEQTELQNASEMSLDEIIAALEKGDTGELPTEALRAAQHRREEITPRLIDVIRRTIAAVEADPQLQDDGAFFALFLLTEFRAKEALPTILDAARLPEEGPYHVFGEDVMTEVLPRTLAALATDSPDVIDSLISDASVHKFVRWAAAQTYLFWVRDGRLTRDDAVARLRGHLTQALANRDINVVEVLVSELTSYAPLEAMTEIKEAFRQNLVDECLIDMQYVESCIAEGESHVRKALRDCSPSGIDDTVEELSSWSGFDPQHKRAAPAGGEMTSEEANRQLREVIDRMKETLRNTGALDDATVGTAALDDDVEPDISRTPPETIRRNEPKIGRNEPCPCGSGRKYKKCCGAAS